MANESEQRQRFTYEGERANGTKVGTDCAACAVDCGINEPGAAVHHVPLCKFEISVVLPKSPENLKLDVDGFLRDERKALRIDMGVLGTLGAGASLSNWPQTHHDLAALILNAAVKLHFMLGGQSPPTFGTTLEAGDFHKQVAALMNGEQTSLTLPFHGATDVLHDFATVVCYAALASSANMAWRQRLAEITSARLDYGKLDDEPPALSKAERAREYVELVDLLSEHIEAADGNDPKPFTVLKRLCRQAQEGEEAKQVLTARTKERDDLEAALAAARMPHEISPLQTITRLVRQDADLQTMVKSLDLLAPQLNVNETASDRVLRLVKRIEEGGTAQDAQVTAARAVAAASAKDRREAVDALDAAQQEVKRLTAQVAQLEAATRLYPDAGGPVAVAELLALIRTTKRYGELQPVHTVQRLIEADVERASWAKQVKAIDLALVGCVEAMPLPAGAVAVRDGAVMATDRIKMAFGLWAKDAELRALLQQQMHAIAKVLDRAGVQGASMAERVEALLEKATSAWDRATRQQILTGRPGRDVDEDDESDEDEPEKGTPIYAASATGDLMLAALKVAERYLDGDEGEMVRSVIRFAEIK